MKLIFQLTLNALAVLLTSYILPGVYVESLFAALIVSLVLGVLNVYVRPILVAFTLPLTAMTMGIFLLVINAVIALLASWLVPGFLIKGFLWAVVFSIVLTIFGFVLSSFSYTKREGSNISE